MAAPVPEANRDAYLAHAESAVAVFREHGALSVAEAWGVDVPEGEITSFPLAVKREPGETVVVSWIVWPSRAVCDAAWGKIANDPRMSPEANPMPFDGRRLILGGFDLVMER